MLSKSLSSTRTRFSLGIVCVRCFARALFVGVARRATSHPRRIAIVQLAKMGDMVCTTPVFRAIKKIYPAANVSVVGTALNKELLDGNPDIDEYLVWDGNISSMVKKIKEHTYDVICITAPSVETLAAAYLAGVPCIVCPRIEGGWSPYETHMYRLLRRLAIVVPHRMKQYAPREYLRLLEPLSIISEDTTKHLFYSKQAEEKAAAFVQHLSRGLLVGIAPAAGNKIKEWPAERFAEVAEYMTSTYNATIIVFGGSGDTHEVDYMMEHVSQRTNVHVALNMFSIDELKAIIARLGLFISADTGPIYIAEAFGIPTVDIVGPVDEREQPPIGKKNIVVIPSRRIAPVLFVMNARVYDKMEAERQAKDTSTQMVTTAVDELLVSLHAIQ